MDFLDEGGELVSALTTVAVQANPKAAAIFSSAESNHFACSSVMLIEDGSSGRPDDAGLKTLGANAAFYPLRIVKCG